MDTEGALALLNAQHTFPSDHRFHVIVRAGPGSAARVSASLAAFCGLDSLGDREVQVPSAKGTYVSLRVTLPCDRAETVLAVYAHLATLPEVVRYL
ncbi:hypothetical protein LBMAG42_46690 [Deltaproteobacteria bacterium]|nr:hypothetical protein LBMAG42_46690 [Deltaproteobacteria bacterium]